MTFGKRSNVINRDPFDESTALQKAASNVDIVRAIIATPNFDPNVKKEPSILYHT